MTRPKVDPDKRQRTAQACDSCKRRKQKCNGIRPCMTCEKRSLTCTYGSTDEGFDEHSSPKRRMVETDLNKDTPHQKSPETPADTPAHQTKIWTPARNVLEVSTNGLSNGVHKNNEPQTLGGFIKSVDAAHGDYEDKKLAVPLNGEGTTSRDSATSQADEEAVVYSNTRMLQDPTVYIGDSATLSFLQLIRMIVDNVAGPSPFTNDPRRHRIVENCLSLPPDFRRTHLLPDKQTANVLVNSYFTNVSGLVEVFYRKTFMTTLEMCYTDPLSVDPSWLCLLYLTFAIGLVMAAPVPGSPEDAIIQKLRAEPVDRAEVFYSDAKQLGDPSTGFEDAGFWSIQALTLMSVYMLAVSKRNAAYAYHGMAVRSAFALGLHREETLPIFSPSEQNVRRKLWRTLFVLDRFLAASLGRPTSIRESDCSGTTLSTEEQPLPQTPFSAGSNENFTTTNNLGLEAAVRSCRVIGVILESVYSSRKISTKVAQEIADSCKKWHKALDPCLNYRHQRSAIPGQGVAILHVNLLYCHSVVLLTRPFFLFVMNKRHQEVSEERKKPGRRSLTRLEKFGEACVAASSHTIALVQTALESQYLPRRNPFVLYFLFASALVVIANEFSSLFPNPDASITIKNAIDIMQYFAQHDTQGSRLLFILTSFQEVAAREQASRRQQSGVEPQHSLVNPTNNTAPISNIFSTGNEQSSDTPATPSFLDHIINKPISNPNITPPSQISPTIGRHTPLPSNNSAYDHPNTHNTSIYSPDNFFDLDRSFQYSRSGPSSDCNESIENAEIDFETLWQWPVSHGADITPGVNASIGLDSEGILGRAMSRSNGNGFGAHGMVDSSVPLFGIASAEFGGP